MRKRVVALGTFLVVSFSLCNFATADTKDTAKDTAKIAAKVAKGALRRARRATAIGPFVGASGGLTLDSSDLDFGFSFGLGFYFFKVPIVPDIQKMIEERVKARMKKLAKDAVLRGEKPTRETLESMGRQIYEEVKAEILGERAIWAKTFEKPRFALVFETARMFSSDTWQARTTMGIGVGPVTVGGTIAGQFGGDKNLLFLGPEIGLKMLPGKGARSPVIDFFARYDFAFNDSPANGNQVVIGARVLLDII